VSDEILSTIKKYNLIPVTYGLSKPTKHSNNRAIRSLGEKLVYKYTNGEQLDDLYSNGKRANKNTYEWVSFGPVITPEDRLRYAKRSPDYCYIPKERYNSDHYQKAKSKSAVIVDAEYHIGMLGIVNLMEIYDVVFICQNIFRDDDRNYSGLLHDCKYVVDNTKSIHKTPWVQYQTADGEIYDHPSSSYFYNDGLDYQGFRYHFSKILFDNTKKAQFAVIRISKCSNHGLKPIVNQTAFLKKYIEYKLHSHFQNLTGTYSLANHIDNGLQHLKDFEVDRDMLGHET